MSIVETASPTLNDELGKLELPLQIIDPSALAQPELDLNFSIEHAWLADATPQQIDAKRGEGYRLFRAKLSHAEPRRFSAVFVRNKGAYARKGGDWAFDLTAAQVEDKAADAAVRIVSVAPYRVNKEQRFVIAFMSNKQAQKKTYKAVLNETSLANVQERASSFGGRVTDLNGEGLTQLSPSDAPSGHLCAVMIKNEGADAREQRMGTAKAAAIHLDMQVNGKPARLVAVEQVTEDTFHYVMEARAPKAYAWWYHGLIEQPPAKQDATIVEAGEVDDLAHVARRLGARYVELKPYNVSGPTMGRRYFAILTDNAAVPKMGKSVLGALGKTLDGIMARALKQYAIAGAVVAVARNGELAYARGFAHADVEKGILTKPDTLFRIASVSKPITASAILHMIETGMKIPGTDTALTLDTKPFFEIFASEKASASAAVQAELEKLTVRHLLEQRSGLNPGTADLTVQSLSGVSSPADVVAHPDPLVAEPGTTYVYQNGNYRLLGALIERVSGLSYAEFVRTWIFDPLNIKRIVVTGSAAPGAETKYYDNISPANRTRAEPSQPHGAPRSGADAAAGAASPGRHASGRWAASPIDVMRLATAVDGSRAGPQLLQDGWQQIAKGGTDGFGQGYGLGMAVIADAGDVAADVFDLEHGGLLPGSTLSRWRVMRNGVSLHWAINGWDYLEHEQPSVANFIGDELVAALESAPEDDWPTTDLFPDFGFPLSVQPFWRRRFFPYRVPGIVRLRPRCARPSRPVARRLAAIARRRLHSSILLIPNGAMACVSRCRFFPLLPVGDLHLQQRGA